MGMEIILPSFPGCSENDSGTGVPNLLFYRCLMFNYVRFGFAANMAVFIVAPCCLSNEIVVCQHCLFKRMLRRILLQSLNKS